MRLKSFLPLLLGLTGCAASIPPVQVTRFHVAGAPAPGPVLIAAAPDMSSDSLEFRTYAAAVERELIRLGYATSGRATYRVLISQSQSSRTRTARSPVSIGIGGGTAGGGVGIGLGTSFGLGSTSRTLVATRLAVQIKRAADGATIWEGRAETEAPDRAPASQPGLAADKLARALFQGFPGESGRTIMVP